MRPSLKKLSRYRPRIVTVIVFCVVAATIALANLSFDQPSIRTRFNSYFHHRSYGWPIIWHRLVLHGHYNAVAPRSTVGWYYSAPRLAANIVLWLILLTASSGTCEWLLRRYRPLPRWSMRTLLVFVAMVAGVCAWYAKARNRAALQDEIFAYSTSVERWGPKWLDLLGVDRFRRRIVSADLPYMRTIDEWEVLQLARLPDLRFIELCGDELTPASAKALGGMRQLQTLRVWLAQGPAPSLPAALDGLGELRSLSIKLGDVTVTEPATAGDDELCLADECLVAISQMPRLEALSLSNLPLSGESLARVFGLEDYRRAFVALRESNPGIIIIDGEEMPFFQRMPVRDTPELGVDEYDTDRERPSSWVPGSDMKWKTPQELANFEKEGGRATFYGVTWLQNGRLVTVEFDAPRRGK